MGKKSGPKPPDPVRTAQVQMDVNRQAALDNARMSQITQQTPFGRTFYTGNLHDGSRQQHTELHPMLMNILFGAPNRSRGGMF